MSGLDLSDTGEENLGFTAEDTGEIARPKTWVELEDFGDGTTEFDDEDEDWDDEGKEWSDEELDELCATHYPPEGLDFLDGYYEEAYGGVRSKNSSDLVDDEELEEDLLRADAKARREVAHVRATRRAYRGHRKSMTEPGVEVCKNAPSPEELEERRQRAQKDSRRFYLRRERGRLTGFELGFVRFVDPPKDREPRKPEFEDNAILELLGLAETDDGVPAYVVEAILAR
ncbi:MAG: hypothetical protein WC730_03060 [Patescibacteria group bacterium]